MVYNEEKVEAAVNALVDDLFAGKMVPSVFEEKIWEVAGGKSFQNVELYNMVQFTMESRAFSHHKPTIFNKIIRPMEKAMTDNYKRRMNIGIVKKAGHSAIYTHFPP